MPDERPKARIVEVICPQCSKHLQLRKNRKSGEEFFSCMGYPKCKYTRDYRKFLEEVVAENERLWAAVDAADQRVSDMERELAEK